MIDGKNRIRDIARMIYRNSDYRCGQCFGKDQVCPDFRKALTLSEEEKSRWPTEGDAFFIREHGMSRERFDFIHQK